MEGYTYGNQSCQLIRWIDRAYAHDLAETHIRLCFRARNAEMVLCSPVTSDSLTQFRAGSSVVFNYTTCASLITQAVLMVSDFFQQAGIPKPFQANVIVLCVLPSTLPDSSQLHPHLLNHGLVLCR